MEINGLPLHPLVVHAAVVFGPLGALLALVYVGRPRWREPLRWPMLGLAAVAGLSVLAAYVTGHYFLNSRPELRQIPELAVHRSRAKVTLVVTFLFTLTAFATAWLHTRPGGARTVALGVLALTAAATVVMVALTGDAGARTVYGR
ncbi:MAG: DUF2231 domain-containing protein [Nocardioides sp.]